MKIRISAILSIVAGLAVACDDASEGSQIGAEDTVPGLEDAVADSGTATSDAGETDQDTRSSPDAADASDVGAGDDTTRDAEDDIEGGSDAGGSGVRPMNLVVTSNGREIGWLTGPGTHALYVWDPTTDLIFGVNDTTGFVVGNYEPTLFNDPACTEIVEVTTPTEGFDCESIPRGRRSNVRAVGGDQFGLTRPSALYVRGPAALPWTTPRNLTDEGCEEYDEAVLEAFADWCYWPMERTTAIPTAFDLPIEVRELAP